VNGLRKYSFTDEDFNLDRRMINAMAYTPVSLFQPVWTMLESDLKERKSKAMPVFNHFDKYLVRWYRRLQKIVRPHPDFDTFLKVLCEEWIFIKTNIKKHMAKLKTFEVARRPCSTGMIG
jgi:hypothetical protein